MYLNRCFGDLVYRSVYSGFRTSFAELNPIYIYMYDTGSLIVYHVILVLSSNHLPIHDIKRNIFNLK